MVHRREKRSRIAAFVNLVRRIEKHADAIVAAVELGLSNSRLEGINAKIRLVPRRGYGFRDLDALTAAIYLRLGGVTLNVGEHPDLAPGQFDDGLGEVGPRGELVDPLAARAEHAADLVRSHERNGPMPHPYDYRRRTRWRRSPTVAPGMNQCAAGSGPVGLA